MKSTKRTITSIATLFLTAAMIASTAAAVSAETVSAGTESTSISCALQDNRRTRKPKRRDGKRSRWDDEEKKKDNSPDDPAARTRTIYVKHSGWYSIKNLKIYGREASNLAADGSLGPGKWVQLNDKTSMAGLDLSNFSFDISTVYESFAFSFDVVGGTDFPYSGVFWTDNDCTRLQEIKINIDGTCRMADVKIMVGDRTVVNETNCSSHSEWKP